ncbi:MAG: type II secretion system protein [Planctomycetes bacterium]|nr:type II secretion system protein [Planctomycetota bacterium]
MDNKVNCKNGFTLIELLIVIGIITLLMSIVLVGASWLKNKARIDATAMLIRKIESALSEYNLAFDAYPPDEYTGDGKTYKDSQNLYYFLGRSFDIEQGYDPAEGGKLKKKFGPAVAGGFNKIEVKDDYIIDAWGNKITYQNPGEDHSSSDGKNNESFVDMESWGSNGVEDEDGSSDDDDINNWKQDKYKSK